MLAAILCGAAAWLAEAAALVALTRGLNVSVSYPQAIFALLALNVSIAVPLLPANVGAFETGIAVGLHHAGVPISLALAAAVTQHSLQIATTTIWGSVATMIDAVVRTRKIE